MAQTVKASHLFSISGWSKFALLIIWVTGDLVLSYFALLIKELTETSGLNIRFRESSHILGGQCVAILACDSFHRPRAFSKWVYGMLFHTAKLGSWYRIDTARVGRDASSWLCGQPEVLPSSHFFSKKLLALPLLSAYRLHPPLPSVRLTHQHNSSLGLWLICRLRILPRNFLAPAPRPSPNGKH